MGSSSDIFQQVRAAVDIVEVVGEHVALKRAGREFKGLCPFHDDHKPSMAVVPHKQIFHCFVCGMGGDVFRFVKEFHKMGNGEALRMLAQRAGIKLPELPGRGAGGEKAEGPSVREQIAQTNEWACDFFQKHLRTSGGKAGLDYLHSRGLTDETIDKFRLGMAPDSRTGTVNAALRLGIPPEHLDQAGLVKKRQDGSMYDGFYGRVIFPIIDSTGGGGRVIAFGGRILKEKRDAEGNITAPKYLNSPETRLFIKSESMYGLNHARQQIVRTRTAVVVEGYMDVIACHQAGVHNVIATLGTALTPEHARGLKNYAQTIILMFDSDDAGFRAADRAMEVFVRGTLDIKLSSVPDGKDPCDFCMKRGGEEFQKLVEGATDAMDYKWERMQQQFSATDSLAATQEAAKEFMRFAAAAMEGDGGGGEPTRQMDPVRRGLLISKIARRVGMSVEEAKIELKRLAGESRTTRPEIRNDAQTTMDASPNATTAVRVNVAKLQGLDAAEGWLLGALISRSAIYEKVRDDLALNLFVTLRPLAAALLEYLENHADLSECTLADLTGTLHDQELVRQAIELERRTSEWQEPSNLSPMHVKMLQQLAEDRGMTLETLVGQSLVELQNARGTTDLAAEADLAGEEQAAAAEVPTVNSSDDIHRAWFEQIAKRNQRGGNPRITG